ncbi:hypothetical protein M422DRAFT_260282 [Sphaerobolus stellatus SS14]|uniref:Uncharacterized protein n=1 Tax=Sphaerobolus stellatus (strain SS14) TaxID=990650 RepID=A0A0C9URC2_SPHS4|nr:hypothetical protein M422DRAFT_260282 [Sphaerobolus stellatus SS14]
MTFHNLPSMEPSGIFHNLPAPSICFLSLQQWKHLECSITFQHVSQKGMSPDTTALTLAGVSDSTIQAMGRWSLDTWRIYIRKHPILLQALMHGHSVFQIPSLSTAHSLPSPSRE